MRNKILFENKRDHIINDIHAAFLEQKMWIEAESQSKNIDSQGNAPCINSIQQVLHQETPLYCITEASWKSAAFKIGIEWSLHSRQGTLQIQGSAAIQPTISPLVAEALAMLLAVQQMNMLYYKKIMFITDCHC